MEQVTIGRVVIYRSRTGDYDVPAIVTATTRTLNPAGVESGGVPALTDHDYVHLTVLTPGLPGQREEAENLAVSKAESEGAPRSENVAGTYQEWDVPKASTASSPEPGSWRWPNRV